MTKRKSLKKFIEENMSAESQKRIQEKTEMLIKEFDGAKMLSDKIKNMQDLSDFVLDIVENFDNEGIEKYELKAILMAVENLK